MKTDPKEPEIQVISWYERDDWTELRTVLSDAHLLPARYDDWLQLAEKAIKDIESQGIVVIRVTIDTVLFPAWCREREKAPDAESRTLFAIETVQKQQFMNNL